ncbi:hypothetical protein A6R68_15468 [Neotoma lepida]|uniref:Myeloid leukemia factor 2 n=1 Tax=Neotoma lepida TaxID=56216 RepID=A0A1A6H820_NEOLE|nr:hypothetical protein A6R68_15468 [Neotoma lepida]
MFCFLRDVEPEDPTFQMDPFAIHHQHMNHVLSGSFGYSPFLSVTDGNMPATRPINSSMQAGAGSPFRMLGMSVGFMNMFEMMSDMIGNMEPMAAGGNCQTFSVSTVISYSNTGDGLSVTADTEGSLSDTRPEGNPLHFPGGGFKGFR